MRLKIKSFIFIFLAIEIIFVVNIFSIKKLDDRDDFDKVVKRLDTPEKIANWIKTNIKYVSKYGINEFNDPEKTFELKEGNCAEMAKLTFYFLQSHGFNPNLLVIQLGPSDPKNHVVCIFESDDKKINKIDNGNLSKGYNSYEEVALKHDREWWRYLLFDNLDSYDEFKNPVVEIYQDKSKKIIKKHTISQDEIISFYKMIKDKLGKSTSKNAMDKNNKYVIMYYGDTDFESLGKSNKGNSTGWSHLIYYKNNTGKKNIYSIIINGCFYGNDDKFFQFYLVDTVGKTFYTSEEYPYSSFEKDKYNNKEFIMEVKDAPKEFFIIVKTFSTRENGVSIILIPTAGNVYSYNYSDSKNFNEYKNDNLAIYPKLY